ncbi:integrase [Opitutaceae bacterium EW11]|nr:integrase [Opitutaceae bacterium EW11]
MTYAALSLPRGFSQNSGRTVKPALAPPASPPPAALGLDAPLPPVIARAGPKARSRFVEFFAAHIRNPNTREAYARALARFFHWAETRGLKLRQLKPVVIAAYVEELGRELSPPSVKQHLAAIRVLCDFFVLGQVLPWNPAASVRGPKYVVKRGKTPVLTRAETRKLLDSIPVDTVIGLRDRALIGVLLFGFARISAAVGAQVCDYRPERRVVRLLEKGGKPREVPVHRDLAGYLDPYLEAAKLVGSSPLFPSVAGKTGKFTDHAMTRGDALRMVKRRASAVGLSLEISCHSFRGTGITAYLAAGGTIERAQAMAGHESPQTTKLYDRTTDELTPEELERVHF